MSISPILRGSNVEEHGWKCARCPRSYMRQPTGQLGRGTGHAPTREGDFHSALPGNDQRGLALSLIRICIVLLCIPQSPRTGVPQLAQRSCICSPCVSAKAEAAVTSLGDRGRLESNAGLPQPSPRNAALCHDPASTLSKKSRWKNRDIVHLKRCRIALLARSGNQDQMRYARHLRVSCSCSL